METHAHVQLTIYELAFARRTALPLTFFSVAGSTRRSISRCYCCRCWQTKSDQDEKWGVMS